MLLITLFIIKLLAQINIYILFSIVDVIHRAFTLNCTLNGKRQQYLK